MARASIRISRKKPSLKNGPALKRPVTLVILTWNAVEETIALIDSMRETPLPSNCDILFIDNGSKDYTVDYLLKFAEAEIIINPENLGYTKAANQGISSTRNDIILLNNDTAILQKNWIQLLQETAYSAENVGPVGCRLVGKDGNVLHAGGWFNTKTMKGGNISCAAEERTGILRCIYVCFGCVYLKRSVLDKCGLLNEEYFAYFEDLEYCLKAQLLGYRSLMDGRVNLLHSQGASGRANKDILDIEAVKAHSGDYVFRPRWQHLVSLLDPPNSYDD